MSNNDLQRIQCVWLLLCRWTPETITEDDGRAEGSTALIRKVLQQYEREGKVEESQRLRKLFDQVQQPPDQEPVRPSTGRTSARTSYAHRQRAGVCLTGHGISGAGMCHGARAPPLPALPCGPVPLCSLAQCLYPPWQWPSTCQASRLAHQKTRPSSRCSTRSDTFHEHVSCVRTCVNRW